MKPEEWAAMSPDERQAYATGQPVGDAAGKPQPAASDGNSSPAAPGNYTGKRPAPTDKDRFRWHLADLEYAGMPDLTRVVDDVGELLRFIWHDPADGWQTVHSPDMHVRLLRTIKAAQYPGSSAHASKDMFDRLLAAAGREPHHRIDRHDSGWLLLRREPPDRPGRQGVHLATGEIRDVPKSALTVRRLHADPRIVAEMLEAGQSHPARRQWEQRLEEWLPSVDMRTMLQVLVGQALAGNPEQKMVFLIGTGANGKTRFTEALRQMFGLRQTNGLACSIDSKELAPRRQSDREPRLAALENMRLVISSELVGQATWNLEILKLITGGDIMPIRELYREPRDIRPAGLLLVHANNQPRLNETSTAIRRRLIIAPFTQKFAGTVPVGRLEAEAASPAGRAAVLTWALEGLQWWQTHQRIPIAPEAADALTDYISDHDLIGEIISTTTIPAPGERLWTKKLLETARSIEDTDIPEWLDNRKFTRLVKASEWETTKVGNRTYVANRQLKGHDRLVDAPM